MASRPETLAARLRSGWFGVMARPTRLTDPITAALAAATADGLTLPVAARRAGVGKTTARRWLTDGQQALAVGDHDRPTAQLAMAIARARRVATIHEARVAIAGTMGPTVAA